MIGEFDASQNRRVISFAEIVLQRLYERGKVLMDSGGIITPTKRAA